MTIIIEAGGYRLEFKEGILVKCEACNNEQS